MKANERNKQNRKEELKEIDLDSVSGGVSSASMSIDLTNKKGELSVQSDSVDTAVDIFDFFSRGMR